MEADRTVVAVAAVDEVARGVDWSSGRASNSTPLLLPSSTQLSSGVAVGATTLAEGGGSATGAAAAITSAATVTTAAVALGGTVDGGWGLERSGGGTRGLVRRTRGRATLRSQ